MHNYEGCLLASDFDKTLTFNDTGYVLSELLGIATEEFERKIEGMTLLNLVQQGAELSYLLLHDPEFRSRVRKDHLIEAGKRIRLKSNFKQAYEILDHRIEGVPLRILCSFRRPGGSDSIGA